MLLLLSVVILMITCNEASSLDIVCSWSPWKPLSECKDGTQTLNRYCLCNGQVVTNTRLCPFENDVIIVECSTVVAQECQWTWSNWSPCSRPCGMQYPGNSTRVQNCVCSNQIVDSNLCVGASKTESVFCNVFPCNSKKPSSSIQWLNEKIWPLSKNTTFNCYRSTDPNGLSSKSWEQILSDSVYPNSTTWHYLAKEYITARLNYANGSLADNDIIILEEGQFLLGRCDGYPSIEARRAEQAIQLLSSLNTASQPLGGVSQSDLSTKFDIKGGSSSFERSSSSSISIVLPVVAILAGLLVMVGFILFKKRMNATNQTVVKESFTSSEDSSTESNERDDRSAEELRL